MPSIVELARESNERLRRNLEDIFARTLKRVRLEELRRNLREVANDPEDVPMPEIPTPGLKYWITGGYGA